MTMDGARNTIIFGRRRTLYYCPCFFKFSIHSSIH